MRKQNIIFFSAFLIFSLIFLNIYFYRDIKTQNQLIANTARAMVITCMDFRLIDDVVIYLNKNGYKNNYNDYIIAGASLGYNQDQYPNWSSTFEDHIDLSLKLHNINEIIIMEHQNCGAYKLLIPDYDPSKELEYHRLNLELAKKKLNQKYPNLIVKTLFMKLNGEVINL